MFGTPKAPVSDESRAWLDSAIERLTVLFGEERLLKAPVVLPTRDFFPTQWSSPEEAVEILLQRVCALLDIPRERIDLVLEYEEERPRPMIGIPVQSSGYAGTYSQHSETGRERVVVVLGAGSEPVSLVSTLAHELCHVLLLGDGKIGREEADGELLTDFLVVFLGFGVLAANSVFKMTHHSDVHGSSQQMSRKGYLSEAELGYALALWARRRGDTKPKWTRHLSLNPRSYFDQSMRFLEWKAKRA